MANYNVDIAVALKGAKKLTAFNKDVRSGCLASFIGVGTAMI